MSPTTGRSRSSPSSRAPTRAIVSSTSSSTIRRSRRSLRRSFASSTTTSRKTNSSTTCGDYFLVLHGPRGAPRGQMVQIDINNPRVRCRWVSVVPEGRDALYVSSLLRASHLVLTYLQDAHSSSARLRCFRFSNDPTPAVVALQGPAGRCCLGAKPSHLIAHLRRVTTVARLSAPGYPFINEIRRLPGIGSVDEC